jgi:hypothetical protein
MPAKHSENTVTKSAARGLCYTGENTKINVRVFRIEN